MTAVVEARIFFPITRFPHGAEIGWCTPLYHAVRLTRGLAQGPLGLEQAASAVWIVAAAGVLLWIVPKRFRAQMVC